MKMIVAASAALVAAAPASGEVVKSRDHGFELAFSRTVPGTPNETFEAFGNVQQWWDEAHSYSGSAANLSMTLRPGGCFCETFPNGGGVEHLRVTHADPGKRLVLTGGLGPLLFEATSGVMDVQFKPAGAGTQVIVNYRVAGFANGGAAALAPLVDKMLADAIARFAVYATPPRTLR
jgi:uncharacterized protein YndB with AHSA1/START domain